MMQQQGHEPLELHAQPERVVRAIQRFLIAFVWTMALFSLLFNYLRYGQVRPSTILSLVIPIIVTVVFVIVRPRHVLKNTQLPTLVVDDEGIQLQGGLASLPLVPWAEIASVRAIRPLGLEYLQLVPREHHALKKLLGPGWLNHWLPGGMILPVSAFGPARQIAAQLEKYRQRRNDPVDKLLRFIQQYSTDENELDETKLDENEKALFQLVSKLSPLEGLQYAVACIHELLQVAQDAIRVEIPPEKRTQLHRVFGEIQLAVSEKRLVSAERTAELREALETDFESEPSGDTLAGAWITSLNYLLQYSQNPKVTSLMAISRVLLMTLSQAATDNVEPEPPPPPLQENLPRVARRRRPST